MSLGIKEVPVQQPFGIPSNFGVTNAASISPDVLKYVSFFSDHGAYHCLIDAFHD